ncbi:MAG: Crp/Fnr family transcriptional regulator [Rhodospirillales bacterium]|nr:Crp/Fnr family transcriptional regulator [Rhodospirillales bacterium]
MIERPDWLSRFPALAALEPDAARLLRGQARRATIPAGTMLYQEGGECRDYLLVLSGSVRVQKVSDSGREIVLYRVEPGQSCVLTTNCLMTGEAYGAAAVSESEVVAVIVPASVFQALLAQSAAFRGFVFSVYATRIADLLMLIEEVAFGRIDMRLAHYLLEHAQGEGWIKATHQDLAVELGTAREVISRQLKEFERRGWMALHRGRMEVLDAPALRSLAGKRSQAL